MTFVVALAPASLQTRAAALSTACPRRPKILAREHAARWWPNGSIWRPHRHTRDVRGKGRRMRRRRRILNNWGCRTAIRGLVGTHVNGAPVMGPLCNRTCSWLARRASTRHPETPVQLGMLPHAATLVWPCQVHNPLVRACVCGPRSPEKSSLAARIHQRGPDHEAPQRHGVTGCPSNSLMIMSATAGCRALIIGKQAAQLAQKAERLVWTALRRPTLPGTVEVAVFRVDWSWLLTMFSNVHTHTNNPLSCASANARTLFGYTVRNR